MTTKKLMKIQTLKNKLLRLRNSLSRKKYGTEATIENSLCFVTIKTTIPTGPISRKEISAKVEVDDAFLNAGVMDQEKILISKLEKEKDNEKTKN